MTPQNQLITLDVQENTKTPVCPTNGKLGKPVDTLTLKALLGVSLTEVRETKYRFCPDASCPTVYYSEDGLQQFAESDLREQVYQKHPEGDNVFICYCFLYTIGSIRKDITELEPPVIPAAINAGVKAGKCACDIRNPQGSCCLGNVNNLVKSIQVVQ